MKRNEIDKIGDDIYRVLSVGDSSCLVIDCKKQAMPFQMANEKLSHAEIITEEELLDTLHYKLPQNDEITASERKKAQEAYNLVACIVPYIDDVSERNEMIDRMARKSSLTKQTIRKHLCQFLVYQDYLCFAPKRTKKALTKDQENYRYILNKYYYTSARRTLHTCYLYLLREKYSDANGKLLDEYPQFYQFRYFYRKTRKTDSCIISRYGRYQYDRDYRPLLGDSRTFFNRVGFGEVDSTIADIWLVDDNSNLIGRPIITAMVCPFSELLLGYTVGLEGGVPSLCELMQNVNSDKVELCRKYGIEIDKSTWANSGIPSTIITDRGKEYLSDTYSHLTDIGVDIINLRQFSPNDKGMVEQFFNIIQNYFKQYLFNNGVIREDFNIRGAPDYRKKASLTLDEFNSVLLRCILHYNSKRIVDTIPYQYIGKIKPYANDIFMQSESENPNCFISISKGRLSTLLLPRTEGKFKRNGLLVNGLRYRAYNFINDYLDGGSAIVAYDPYDVSKVHLIRDNEYYQFDLINDFFNGKSLSEANEIKKKKREILGQYQSETLQSEMDLGRQIDDVAHYKISFAPNVKDVRQHRNNVITTNKIKKG